VIATNKLREQGPDESGGYSDKSYWKRMEELCDLMDAATQRWDGS
jgi:hypothetical protein